VNAQEKILLGSVVLKPNYLSNPHHTCAQLDQMKKDF